MTYREFAERYAGMTFDGSETSPLWDLLVPDDEIELAAEGRRLNDVGHQATLYGP